MILRIALVCASLALCACATDRQATIDGAVQRDAYGRPILSD